MMPIGMLKRPRFQGPALNLLPTEEYADKDGNRESHEGGACANAEDGSDRDAASKDE